MDIRANASDGVESTERNPTVGPATNMSVHTRIVVIPHRVVGGILDLRARFIERGQRSKQAKAARLAKQAEEAGRDSQALREAASARRERLSAVTEIEAAAAAAAAAVDLIAARESRIQHVGGAKFGYQMKRGDARLARNAAVRKALREGIPSVPQRGVAE